MYELTGHLAKSGYEYRAGMMMSDAEWGMTIRRMRVTRPEHRLYIDAFKKLTKAERVKIIAKLLFLVGVQVK